MNRSELWRTVRREVVRGHPGLRPAVRRHQVIRHLINREVTDALEESHRRLQRRRIESPLQAQRCEEPIIAFSAAMRRQRAPLKQLLWDELYHHYRVLRMAHKARRTLTALFEAYLAHPEQLPNTSRARLRTEEAPRVICDYIAGMTDRYAIDEYKKLFLPDAKS